MRARMRGAGEGGRCRALRAVVAVLVCLASSAEVEAAEFEIAPRAPGEGVAPPGAGARLRAGIAALEEGDDEQAARLFAAAADDYPIVGDHAERLWIKALLELSHYATAAHLASRFEVAYPSSPLRGEVLRMLGDARDALGAPAAARAAWRRARSEARDPEARARLDLSVAASYEGSGSEWEASRAYLAVWTEAPTSEAAKTAEKALKRLEGQSGRSLRTPPQLVKRARALYEARANQRALACYDLALEENLPRNTRKVLQRERAFTLFRLRRYPEAVVAFAQLGEGRDDRFWRARSLARSGRVTESIREFEKLSEGRFDVLAARSLLLSAILREDEADCTSATASYVRVASKAPTQELREAARWRLGWCAYREQRYREAAEHFAALARAMADPLERLGARYWRARSLEKLGAPDGPAEFRAIATAYPLTYYGWQAARRLDESSLLREVPERPMPSPVSFGEVETGRIAILIEAGLLVEAETETRVLAGSARSLDDRLAVAHLFSAAQQFYRAERVVLDPYAERLAEGPEPGLEELWWYAWPTAFADLASAAAEAWRIDPALLSAVMREESGFQPDALSTVGARGLTQIMPDTGERLARSLGLQDYQPDDLFTPATNLLMGAYYLGQLMERFEGRISAAVASYNAGPDAVARWIEAQPDAEDDEWVEAIPYEQTRAYVKRVLSSQQIYRVLY